MGNSALRCLATCLAVSCCTTVTAQFEVNRVDDFGNASRAYRNLVPIKAVRYFDRNFREAEYTVWKIYSDRLIAFFSYNDVQERVTYDTEGEWISTKKFGRNSILEPWAADLVNENRDGFRLYGIIAHHNHHKPDVMQYQVTLKKGKSIRVLRFSKEEVLRVEDLQNADPTEVHESPDMGK